MFASGVGCREQGSSSALKSILPALPGFEEKMTRVIKLISKASDNPPSGLSGSVCSPSEMALSPDKEGHAAAEGYHRGCDRHNCFHFTILHDGARQVIETAIFQLTHACQSSELVNAGSAHIPKLY